MRRLLLPVVIFCVLASSCCRGQAINEPAITLLASDGNLYGTRGAAFFQYNPITSNVTVLNSNDGNLTLCLERPNGTLLGITNGSSLWQFVSVTLAGQITTIVQFPAGDGVVACPAMANDGNYYGSFVAGGTYSEGGLYQLTASGALNFLYYFPSGGIANPPTAPPVQASDGNLYFLNGITLERYSATSGLTYVEIPSGGYTQAPIEGADGNFYAADGPNVFQITPTGGSTIIYTAQQTMDGEEGTLSPLFQLGAGLAVLQGYSYVNELNDCLAFGNYYSLLPLSLSGTAGPPLWAIGSDEIYASQTDEYYPALVLSGNGAFFTGYADSTTQDNGTSCTYSSTGPSYGTVTSAVTPAPIQLAWNKTHVLPGDSATATWSVNNAYSDTAKQCYGYGGLGSKLALTGSLTANAPSTPGAYTVAIVCGGTQTATATLDVGISSVSLAATNATVYIGQTATLTATIAAGTPAATGTMQFLYGGNVIGTASVVNSAATLNAKTTGLPAGTYSITAHYLGDSNYGASTSNAVALTLVVKTPTTIVLNPSSQSVIQGNTMTLAALVTGAFTAESPTGTVTFLSGTTVLGTGKLTYVYGTTSEAKLTEPTASIPPGTYSITASYGGDIYNYASKTASAATVTITTSNVKVSAAPNPVPANSSLTLSATVTGKITPTGTVSFYAYQSGTSTELTSSTLSSGVGTATLPAGTLAAGTYGISAYYFGDANNPAESSPMVSVVVQ